MRLEAALIAGAQRSGRTEADLLNDLALHSSMHRAGFVPSLSHPILCEVADRDLPALDAGADHLRQCIEEDEQLVAEWCVAAQKAGWRIPDTLLPELLDLATRKEGTRKAILGVLGDRGRWLAGLNPEWQPLVTDQILDPEKIWNEGTTEERAQLLETVDPEERRALLESTWKEEPLKTKSVFVGILAERAGPEDRQFLESLLENRSAEIRYAAIIGLSRLSGSAVARDVFALAREFVRFNPFGVSVPEGDDSRFDPFGIPSTKGAATAYERRTRLQKLVALVVPSFWESAGSTTDELLAQIPDDQEARIVKWGLAVAAQTYGDSRWAAAFLRLNEPMSNRTELAELLTPEQQEQVAFHQLRHRPKNDRDVWQICGLGAYLGPWTAAFTRAFFEAVVAHGKLDVINGSWARIDGKPLDPTKPLVRPFPDALYRTHPDVPSPEPPDVDWVRFLEWRDRICDLRRAMLQTIHRSPKP